MQAYQVKTLTVNEKNTKSFLFIIVVLTSHSFRYEKSASKGYKERDDSRKW